MDNNTLVILIASFIPFLGLIVLRYRAALPLLYFALLPFPLAMLGEATAGNVSVADLLAGVALLTVILQRPNLRAGPAGSWMLVYLAVAVLSSVLAGQTQEGVLGLGRMLLVTAVPMLWFANGNYSMQQIRQFVCVYCISTAALGVCALYYFVTGGAAASMSTLGINKNALGPIFGTSIAIGFTATMTHSIKGKYWSAVMATLILSAIGLLLSFSRASWIGTIVAVVGVMLLTRRTKPAIVSIVVLAPILGVLWSQMPDETISYATNVSSDAYVVRARLDAQQSAFQVFEDNPLLGVGVGLRRQIEPHDVFILTLGETGVAGLAAFVLMIGGGLLSFVRVLRRFDSETDQWRIALAGLAVFAVFHVQTLADVYWRRGVGAMSWASVGMSIALLNARGSSFSRRVVHPPEIDCIEPALIGR